MVRKRDRDRRMTVAWPSRDHRVTIALPSRPPSVHLASVLKWASMSFHELPWASMTVLPKMTVHDRPTKNERPWASSQKWASMSLLPKMTVHEYPPDQADIEIYKNIMIQYFWHEFFLQNSIQTSSKIYYNRLYK